MGTEWETIQHHNYTEAFNRTFNAAAGLKSMHLTATSRAARLNWASPRLSITLCLRWSSSLKPPRAKDKGEASRLPLLPNRDLQPYAHSLGFGVHL